MSVSDIPITIIIIFLLFYIFSVPLDPFILWRTRKFIYVTRLPGMARYIRTPKPK